GLDEQEVAGGAGRRSHVEVKGNFLSPPPVGGGIGRTASLVDLAEAAVCGGTSAQAVLRAVDAEISLGARIVEGVNDGDRLTRAGRHARQLVRGLQIGRGVEAAD